MCITYLQTLHFLHFFLKRVKTLLLKYLRNLKLFLLRIKRNCYNWLKKLNYAQNNQKSAEITHKLLSVKWFMCSRGADPFLKDNEPSLKPKFDGHTREGNKHYQKMQTFRLIGPFTSVNQVANKKWPQLTPTFIFASICLYFKKFTSAISPFNKKRKRP